MLLRTHPETTWPCFRQLCWGMPAGIYRPAVGQDGRASAGRSGRRRPGRRRSLLKSGTTRNDCHAGGVSARRASRAGRRGDPEGRGERACGTAPPPPRVVTCWPDDAEPLLLSASIRAPRRKLRGSELRLRRSAGPTAAPPPPVALHRVRRTCTRSWVRFGTSESKSVNSSLPRAGCDASGVAGRRRRPAPRAGLPLHLNLRLRPMALCQAAAPPRRRCRHRGASESVLTAAGGAFPAAAAAAAIRSGVVVERRGGRVHPQRRSPLAPRGRGVQCRVDPQSESEAFIRV